MELVIWSIYLSACLFVCLLQCGLQHFDSFFCGSGGYEQSDHLHWRTS
jgi:hypothetical protein